MKRGTFLCSGRWKSAASPIAFVLVVIFLSTWALPARDVDRQTLPGSVPGMVSHLEPVDRLPESQRLDLVIALPLRNQTTLKNLLQQIYDPNSPSYHQYLTPAQFTEQFGPAERDYQTIQAFAQSNGLIITGRHANRTLLDVNGSVGAIEKAFRVNLRTYHHPTEARLFYAPDAAPSLILPTPVLSINGLDNFALPHPMGIITDSSGQSLNGISMATGSGPRGNFIGKDFRAAYAPGVALDGSGQAVGLFEMDDYFPGDIALYESLAGLPAVSLTNVLIDGFSGPPGENNVEVALDIEMAIAMAPGLSKVLVYEGNTANDILNRMATDDAASQLSCSWSFDSAVDPAREQIFEQYAAQGQSFFQASGDVGGGQIDPPSDDPFITVVGGTSLTTRSTNGAWQAETTWPHSSGGISANYPIPAWQQGVNMTTNQGSTTMRNVPDVACLANTNIWLVADHGEQLIAGGTSAAAPLWAGFSALMNQQAAGNNQSSGGFLNPAIYAIGESSAYALAFHDIATGNNTNSSSPDEFFAVPGYDLCTGWGTPNGTNLINALRPAPDVMQATPETGVGFADLVGGSFNPATQSISILNNGTNTLTWSLGNTSIWFNATPPNGSLPAGGTASVTITPRASVNNLPAGQYASTLFLANLDDGFTMRRQIVWDAVNPVTTAAGVVFTNIYSFAGARDGANPNGLTPGTNGNFYGTALNGGSNGFGTVFQMTGGQVTGFYSFTGGADGANPLATLTGGADGNLFGTTFQGGVDGNGTIFSITTDGGLNTLSTFGNTNGALPFAGPASGSDGNLYGTTYQGGAFGRGTAYRMTTNGTLTTLYSFSAISDGGFVAAGLIEGQDGNLYGTTWKGGNNDEGAIFSMTTNGVVTTLISLDDTTGAFPFAGLTQAAAGNFYGVASQGGVYGNGTIFEITAAGEFTNLYSFTGGNDGANPRGTLLLGQDGNYYGTTASGGTNGVGTVFVVSPAGTVSPLVEFNGLNGANPQTALVQASDGTIYGTTRNGGLAGAGVIFQIAIHSSPRIIDQPGNLSVFAGANVQFDVSAFGSTPLTYQWQRDGTNLTDGNNINGASSRMLDLANVTTNAAGNYSVIVSNALGWVSSSNAFLLVTSSPPYIVVQPVNESLPAGETATLTATVLGNLPLTYQWQRDGTNLLDTGGVSGSATGALSISNVTVANDGVYGLTVTNALGSVSSSNVILTVVASSTNGTSLNTLYWFSSAAGVGGGWPPNGLMLADNGDLYGTTEFGRASNNIGAGTIFTLDTNALFSTLISFDDVNGFGPLATLVEDTNGNFYGTSAFGGTNGAGNIFELRSDDTLTNLYSFEANNGVNLNTGLIIGTNGDLWGITPAGGDFGEGSIFILSPEGDFTNLYSFTGGADGGEPVGALVPATDGTFYG
ncbi:MAG: choice-of-anchor tandem repeat GloVer-containing protein, partial [Verrucomicrobiota bacterium]